MKKLTNHITITRLMAQFGITSMTWHDRYKQMKSALKLTNADISDIIGNTPDSIKSTTQPNKALPRWLKLAIVVFESTSNLEKDN